MLCAAGVDTVYSIQTYQLLRGSLGIKLSSLFRETSSVQYSLIKASVRLKNKSCSYEIGREAAANATQPYRQTDRRTDGQTDRQTTDGRTDRTDRLSIQRSMLLCTPYKYTCYDGSLGIKLYALMLRLHIHLCR